MSRKSCLFSIILFSALLPAGCGGEVDALPGEQSAALVREMNPGSLPSAQPAASQLHSAEGLSASTSPLMLNSADADILSFGAYDASGFLQWSGCAPGSRCGDELSAVHKSKHGSNRTQLCDPWGTYCGECVSMVKDLSGVTVQTRYWLMGVNVVSDGGVPFGSAIATFYAGGKYSGHTAFFVGYEYSASGDIVGLEVWDQNYGDAAVRHHTIRTNIKDYYVVEVSSRP